MARSHRSASLPAHAAARARAATARWCCAANLGMAGGRTGVKLRVGIAGVNRNIAAQQSGALIDAPRTATVPGVAVLIKKYGNRRLYDTARLAALSRAAGFEVVEARRFGRYSWPFAHNLIYGVGKTLLESGHVPASLARAVDRRGGESASRASAWRALRAAFLWPDRFNRDDEGPAAATVNLAMRLVRR